MKKEVEFALQDMQEAVRDYGTEGGLAIDVDAGSLILVLRWAEKHGLMPDYQDGDRIKLNRKGFKNSDANYYLREGSLGNVYSVPDDIGHGGYLRVLWDDDPKEERHPTYVKPNEVERVYEW